MRYCFDLDGTLCSDTDGDYPNAIPNLEVIGKLNELYDAGHTIIVYTARGATTGLDWHELVKAQLKAWNVKHHKLIIPGYIAMESGGIEDDLKDWEVVVGPREAAHIPAYLKMWKPEGEGQ